MLKAPALAFVLTRLLVPGLAQGMLMLDRGDGSVEDIDRSMELGAGHPMGPLTLAVRGYFARAMHRVHRRVALCRVVLIMMYLLLPPTALKHRITLGWIRVFPSWMAG